MSAAEEFNKERIRHSKKIIGERYINAGTLRRFLIKCGMDLEKRCVICGTALTGRRTQFCSDACHDYFWSHYVQDHIRSRLVKERGEACEDCKEKVEAYGYPSKLHIHHKVPLFAGGPAFDDDNFILLCTTCHGKAHAGFNKIQKEKLMKERLAKQSKKMTKMKKYWNDLDEGE